MYNNLKLSNVFYLFLVTLLYTNCGQKEDILPEEPEEEWPVGQNVFVAGNENVKNNAAARLWKNGVMQNLTGTAGYGFRSTALISSEARAVFVSGNDVYVAGYDVIVNGDKWTVNGGEIITNGDEVISRARLWKNGEIQNLDPGTLSDQAIAVFVSGNDVYVLGREALVPVPNPWSWAFKVWKNGKVEVFAEGNSNCRVNSIFVSEGIVYIAGRMQKPSGIQATLWKNGMEETLASESSSSCANSVFVSGKDIYVAGDGNSIAKVWKNGKVENLTNGDKIAEAYSVHLSGNDVYIAGREGDDAKFWKNGVVQNVTDDKDARIYHSVFVSGNDVYLAGYVVAVQDVKPGEIPINYFQATLWKNGKKLKLNTDGKYNNSWAFSVFVK